jgi:hypothetical protein
MTKYKDDHPDVVKARQSLADIDKQRADLMDRYLRAVSAPKPWGFVFHPVYRPEVYGLYGPTTPKLPEGTRIKILPHDGEWPLIYRSTPQMQAPDRPQTPRKDLPPDPRLA